MSTLTIYTEKESVRLRYVLDWLFKEQLGISYVLTHNEINISNDSISVTYGKAVKNGFSIPDCSLLWDTDAINNTLDLNIGSWVGLPTLFANDNFDISFDIFSALFFLLSRYEEYFPYSADKHNRYPATESILYKNGWLDRPIVDEWVDAFRKLLAQKIPTLKIREPKFSYHPTYDIDIAWSYKHKGAKRTIGAFAKDLLKGNFEQIAERTNVLRDKENDPYDSFGWLKNLHKAYSLQPTFFILLAKKLGAFDKNINPDHPHLQSLIQNLSKEGKIGIHPSYYANTNCTIAKEEQVLLSGILNTEIYLSRQHYIRNIIPDSYKYLITNGITDDYSMGYGTHLGFRSGTGNSFFWYNLENEEISKLRVHPFCFMDTTAHYDEQLDVQGAFGRLNVLKTKLKNVGAPLTTVFHNFSLGSSKEWLGWRDAYEAFIKTL